GNLRRGVQARAGGRRARGDAADRGAQGPAAPRRRTVTVEIGETVVELPKLNFEEPGVKGFVEYLKAGGEMSEPEAERFVEAIDGQAGRAAARARARGLPRPLQPARGRDRGAQAAGGGARAREGLGSRDHASRGVAARPDRGGAAAAGASSAGRAGAGRQRAL